MSDIYHWLYFIHLLCFCYCSAESYSDEYHHMLLSYSVIATCNLYLLIFQFVCLCFRELPFGPVLKIVSARCDIFLFCCHLYTYYLNDWSYLYLMKKNIYLSPSYPKILLWQRASCNTIFSWDFSQADFSFFIGDVHCKMWRQVFRFVI